MSKATDKMQQETVDTAHATAATVASYASSGGLVIMGLTMHDIAALVGIVLGLATFFVNWYYRHKESKHGPRGDR